MIIIIFHTISRHHHQNGVHDNGIHRAQMREDHRIDTDGLVHANPIGPTPANPIGDDGDVFWIGEEGDVHQEPISVSDKVAMAEFLDGSDFWSYHPASMPNAKKRKNTPSIQTSVCPLREIRA